MAKYKRNHSIPKFMLNYWATQPQDKNYRGVWVYEVGSKRKYFANAQGTTAYSFAAVNDSYVPILDGKRATALERWLSSLEARLADFTRQAHEHQYPLAVNRPEDVVLVLQSLFALECRSRYDIQFIKNLIESSPELASLLAPKPDLSANQLVLENIINYAHEYARQYSHGVMVVLHCETQDVLLCDRPVFNHPTLTPRFFALTNRIIIALAKEPLNSEFSYTHAVLEPDMLELLNRRIALEAREWIVATTESQIEQCILIVESYEWENYRDSEHTNLEVARNSWRMAPDVN